MMLLVKILLFLSMPFLPHYSFASDVIILPEGNREAKVRIHLDKGLVEFTESFWTNIDISKHLYEVFPEKVLRVKATKGDVLLVVPDMERSNEGSLYFLFDDGKNIKEIFRPRSHLAEHRFEVFLFDINEDGVNDFIIQWVDEAFFRFEAYSIQSTTSASSRYIPIIFSSPVLEYPRECGNDVFSIKSDILFVHYNYKNKEKAAQIRVNSSDPTKEPYLYPIGLKESGKKCQN